MNLDLYLTLRVFKKEKERKKEKVIGDWRKGETPCIK